MKTISVSILRLNNESFAQMCAGNGSGTKITLRLPVSRMFGDTGQFLIDQVFGLALAHLIRDDDRYRELEKDYEEKETGQVSKLDHWAQTSSSYEEMETF